MAERRAGALTRRRDEARLALALMSRLPVGRIAAPPTLSAAVWAFPLAGAVAALPGGLVFWVAAEVLPPAMAALLALAAGLVVTGALHEDGLADTADGCGGGSSPARKLEIMRDSRIGSYGALALAASLGLRAAGLAAAPGGAPGALALILVGAASRAPLAVALAAIPAARADGLAAEAATARKGPAAAAAAFGGTAILLMPQPMPALAALLLAAGGAGLLALRQIGGQTGDTLGATQQAGEVALWLVLAAGWAGGGWS